MHFANGRMIVEKGIRTKDVAFDMYLIHIRNCTSVYSQDTYIHIHTYIYILKKIRLEATKPIYIVF